MAPRAKVIASGDIGHGVTFEVRPQKKGSPTVHVDVAGARLPAFRLKDGTSAEVQVCGLAQVKAHIAGAAAATPMDADSTCSGADSSDASSLERTAVHHPQNTQPTQPTQPQHSTIAEQGLLHLQPPQPSPQPPKSMPLKFPVALACASATVVQTPLPPASAFLPPPPWPYNDWSDLCCQTCGFWPAQSDEEPCATLARCDGCDALGQSCAFFCDVKCRRRTPCPHILGAVDLTLQCECPCCAIADEIARDLDHEERYWPGFSASFSSKSNQEKLCGQKLSLHLWHGYLEAMVRANGRMQLRQSECTVDIVLRCIVEAVCKCKHP